MHRYQLASPSNPDGICPIVPLHCVSYTSSIIYAIESKGILFRDISELHCGCIMVLCALLHVLTHEHDVSGELRESDRPRATDA